MLASLDGRIDGAFFGLPQTVPAVKAYGELRSFYQCPATLYGTTTMLGGYAEGRIGPLPPVEKALPYTDWVNPVGKALGNFIVSVDPRGGTGFFLSCHREKRSPCRPCDRSADRAGTS